jgi:dTDP-glucose pyrophosphorylase
MSLSVVILAAGQGKRMKSDLPKVLQPLAGRPLLGHVLDTAAGLEAAATYVVYGHGGEQVLKAFEGRDVRWALQAEQHGTGHAVAQAMPQIPDDHLVLVLYGDVPLVQLDTLARLVAAAGDNGVSLLSVMLPDPTGYGRVVRDGAGNVVRIVEHKDANAKERAIHESNTGLMCVPAGRLRSWLAALRNDNAQGEYYLTDIIVMAVQGGLRGARRRGAHRDRGARRQRQGAARRARGRLSSPARHGADDRGRDHRGSGAVRCARPGDRRSRRVHRRQRGARRHGEARRPRAHRPERGDPRQRDRRRHGAARQLRARPCRRRPALHRRSVRTAAPGRNCTRKCTSATSSR